MTAPQADPIGPLEIARSRLIQAAAPLLRVRDRWRSYEIYVFALLIFAASRVVVVAGIDLGSRFLVRSPDPGKWDAGTAWYHHLLRWDSGWFAAILSEGYRYGDDPNAPSSTVFYPLYPLLSYAVKSLFGVSHWMALLLVANGAAVLAALLLTKFVRDELGDDVALLSVTFFSFFPSSLFLSAGYSEPVCLAFVLASFILLRQERFVFAAVMAGLSLGARSTGIVMIPVILWEMVVQRASVPWSRLIPRMALCAVVAASGLLFYMAYLGIKFGQPFAFAIGQSSWNEGTFLDRFIAAITLAPFAEVNWRLAGWFPVFLVLTIWSFRYLRPSVSLYGLGTLLLPYFTLGVTGSMNRFVLMCFPVFMTLGILCRGRPWLTITLTGIFSALLLATVALFSQWHWVG